MSLSDIQIIDNFLTDYEINEYHKFFESMSFGHGFDNDRKDSARFLSLALKNDVDAIGTNRYEEYLLKKFKKHNLLYLDERLKIVYYNALKIGDKFEYHKDWDGHTFLIYTNKEWYHHWGGQTLFKKGYRTKSVYPSPGRLIIFDGQINHKGSAPSIFNNAFARYSIVFQFVKL